VVREDAHVRRDIHGLAGDGFGVEVGLVHERPGRRLSTRPKKPNVNVRSQHSRTI
jgi:hypothetical protein